MVEQETNLYEAIKDYNKLNNVTKWEEDLRANGYDLEQTATVKLQVLVPADTAEASETNWFDNFCDFVNQSVIPKLPALLFQNYRFFLPFARSYTDCDLFQS